MAPATEPTAAQLIGDMIREARIRLDITKSEAARRAGVSRRTWHEIEEGQRATMTARTLAQFDQVLGFAEGTLYAMTTRSANARVEELRQRAIELVRLMSSDELDVFVATRGRATIVGLLEQLDRSMIELRSELAHRPPRRNGNERPRADV